MQPVSGFNMLVLIVPCCPQQTGHSTQAEHTGRDRAAIYMLALVCSATYTHNLHARPGISIVGSLKADFDRNPMQAFTWQS